MGEKIRTYCVFGSFLGKASFVFKNGCFLAFLEGGDGVLLAFFWRRAVFWGIFLEGAAFFGGVGHFCQQRCCVFSF